MHLCRFDTDRLGLIEVDIVTDVSQALEVLPKARWPFPRGDALIAHLHEVMARAMDIKSSAPQLPLESVRLMSPVANPGKICAAPVNYLKHLQEAEADPATFAREHVRKIHATGLFLKATSAVIGASEEILLRRIERRTDHEIELAVVIGRTADRVTREDALKCVAGYTIGLDITLRGPEERSLRKSIDTYCVLGPWLVTADEIPDPSALELSLRVNGELRQSASTRDLIIDVPGLIELASSFYTLMPGDVILTGTPEGVGPIAPGDVLTAHIDGIGAMTVAVGAA